MCVKKEGAPKQHHRSTKEQGGTLTSYAAFAHAAMVKPLCSSAVVALRVARAVYRSIFPAKVKAGTAVADCDVHEMSRYPDASRG